MPRKGFAFSVPYSPEKTETLLRDSLSGDGCIFVSGEFQNGKFILRKRYPDLFRFQLATLSSISGTIRAEGDGSRVDVTVIPHWSHLAFAKVWLFLSLLWMMFVPVSAAYQTFSNPQFTGSVAAYIGGIFVAIVASIIFWAAGLVVIYMGKLIGGFNSDIAKRDVENAMQRVLLDAKKR